jgi:hypothetical protein
LNYLKKLGFKDSVLQNLITEIPIENYSNFLSEFR